MTNALVRSRIEQRLALYRRYASVIGEQESALDEGDLDRFSELNVARRSIEAEVEAIHWSPEITPDQETLDAIGRAVDSLRSVEARQRQLELKLKNMRQEVGAQIGDLAGRKGGLRSYLQEAAGPARIDVRS